VVRQQHFQKKCDLLEERKRKKQLPLAQTQETNELKIKGELIVEETKDNAF
tara:strand:+ start:44 stop:196 length:153 start_codon:yes stop_codon:yes gene_type:complete